MRQFYDVNINNVPGRRWTRKTWG